MRRNALDFAQAVADAFKEASGIDVQESVDLCSLRLAVRDMDADRREAAFREVFASEFSDDDITRLLSLEPKMNEAATYARAILTGAAQIAGKQQEPQFDLRQLAGMGFLGFLVSLLSDRTPPRCKTPRATIRFDQSVH